MQFTFLGAPRTDPCPLRSSLHGVATLILIGASFASSIGDAKSDETSQKRRAPNIVLIMADDLGYGDLGCYGQRQIRTPNIDRMAAEGLQFTQAYAGSTVCAPSRSCLMTGTHNGATRVRDNVPHYKEYFRDQEVTIAEVLKQTGYACGGVGKWSLGGAGSAGRATNQGFDMWFGYLDQDEAHYYYPETLDDNDGKWKMPGNSKSHEFHSHDLLTDRALVFIEKNKERPFFLYAAYTVPHWSAEEEDATQYPVPSDAPYTDKPWTQREKNYAAMITRMDKDVGRILALIKRLGLDEETLVIFTSDNGPWSEAPKRFDSGGPLRGYKRDLYEGGIRVPLIARWPGKVPTGKVSDEIIAFWDLMPTFAEAAGAKCPEGINGKSALDAILGGKRKTPQPYLYWDYGHCRPRYMQAVRLGRWKGIRPGQGKSLELYDLQTDLGETRDVAADHPEVVERIEKIMETAVTPSYRYPVGRLYEKGKWHIEE